MIRAVAERKDELSLAREDAAAAKAARREPEQLILLIVQGAEPASVVPIRPIEAHPVGAADPLLAARVRIPIDAADMSTDCAKPPGIFIRCIAPLDLRDQPRLDLRALGQWPWPLRLLRWRGFSLSIFLR